MPQQRLNRRSRQWFVASVLAFVMYRGGKARWVDVHKHVLRMGHRAKFEAWGSPEASGFIAQLVQEQLLIEEVNEHGFRVWITLPDHDLDRSRGTSSKPK